MTNNVQWGKPLTGPEIKALGLPGDTPVSADDMPLPLRDWALLSDTPFYRLPADHPAYNVHRYNKEHGTSFVYWAGGERAPADWIGYGDKGRWPEDGNDRTVLYRGHGAGHPSTEKGRWLHYGCDGSCVRDPAGDIIGYTKKPQLVTEEASEPLQRAASGPAPANHGPAADDKGEAGDKIEAMTGAVWDGSLREEADTFTPCERTVRMCIDAVKEKEHLLSSVRAVEALLPKPDRAEDLVEQWRLQHEREIYPKSLTVKAAEEFARWLIERGEIKG